jgi:PBP1b-binding outer membrane lipoprotein LpoB
MKKYISILYILGFLFIFQSCSSQTGIDSQAVTALVNSQNFSFHAERANPTNYDVINVMNSMPNSTSTRILDLSGGYYSIDLKMIN